LDQPLSVLHSCSTVRTFGGKVAAVARFWTEFAIAIGYSGLAMMVLQFGLTARFRYFTAPWGEDVIYHFHCQTSLVAVGLVVAHPLILSAVRPELREVPNFLEVPWGGCFAVLSILSVIALVAMALWLATLKIRYET
jgi:predicted ferric reductase